MLPQLLAWLYSINHRGINIVEDFDNAINFVPKEFFMPCHMNTRERHEREREREREREKKR